MKKTIIYVPCVYRAGCGLWPPTTPSCWYYWSQQCIWLYFSTLTDIKIIWKAGPRSSNLEDPIKLLSSSNIRYSTRKLRPELKKADLVVVDAVSTPMGEALLLGKTVVCVVPEQDEKYVRDASVKDKVVFVRIWDVPRTIIRHVDKWREHVRG